MGKKWPRAIWRVDARRTAQQQGQGRCLHRGTDETMARAFYARTKPTLGMTVTLLCGVSAIATKKTWKR